MGTTDGSADETHDLLEILQTSLRISRALRPTSQARPFSLSNGSVRFDLVLLGVGATANEIITGALVVFNSYVSDYGARDVRSLISCEGRAHGRITVRFSDPSQGSASLSINQNVSSIAADSKM